jgi:hypothetical protein
VKFQAIPLHETNWGCIVWLACDLWSDVCSFNGYARVTSPFGGGAQNQDVDVVYRGCPTMASQCAVSTASLLFDRSTATNPDKSLLTSDTRSDNILSTFSSPTRRLSFAWPAAQLRLRARSGRSLALLIRASLRPACDGQVDSNRRFCFPRNRLGL